MTANSHPALLQQMTWLNPKVAATSQELSFRSSKVKCVVSNSVRSRRGFQKSTTFCLLMRERLRRSDEIDGKGYLVDGCDNGGDDLCEHVTTGSTSNPGGQVALTYDRLR